MPRKFAPPQPAVLSEAHLKPDTNVRYNDHPLLASYRRSLARSGLSPRTFEHYIDSSVLFLEYAQANGFPEIQQVRREHIETWELWMRDERGFSPYTVRNRFVGLRMWIRWLVAEGEIRRDPTERMALPKVEAVDKDVLSAAEIQRVLEEMEKRSRPRNAPISTGRDLAIVSLLYGTGARASEVCAALKTDVDLDAGELRFRAATTKAGEGRTVGLSPTLVDRLDRYLRRRKDALPGLFVGHRGSLTRSGLYEIVRSAFESTGRVIGPHDLRHTSASHAAGNMSESQMMDAYGWRDPEMARHYTRTVRQKLAAEAQRQSSPLERLGGLRG